MSTESPPVITAVSVTPASGPGGTRFHAEVTATEVPPMRLAYQWRLDGTDIAGATGASHVATAGGHLSVQVTVTNAFGADSRESAAVPVLPGVALPEVLETRIVPEVGGIGTRFSVALAATGVPIPALAYQWLLDGVEICGATGASHVARSEGRLSVRVVARNSEGSDSREAAAVAIDPVASAPEVTAALVQPAVGRATVTSFTAAAETAGQPAPALSYQWFLGDVAIPGATDISHVPAADGALKVRITASNGAGTHARESEAVTVMPAVSPPQVRAADILPNAGQAGDTFKVTVTTSGYPEPDLRYEWFLDDRLLDAPTGDTYTSSVPGTIYVRITATSPEGEDTRESGAVLVEPVPAPATVTDVVVTPAAGRVGDRFEAAAEVGGHPAPELTHQWFLDGVAIAGATGASHTADAPGSLHAEVTASNELGSASRASTGVEVAPALMVPVIEALAIAPGAGRVGDVFAASATASGAPAPVLTYQWLRDGVPIEGSTGASHLAQRPSRLSVRVTATNAAGTEARESDAVTVEPALAVPEIVTIGVVPEAGRVGDAFAAVTSVTGHPAPEIGYQWLLNGEEIADATGEVLVASMTGQLSVRVRAENSAGSAYRESITAVVLGQETLQVFEPAVFEEGVFL